MSCLLLLFHLFQILSADHTMTSKAHWTNLRCDAKYCNMPIVLSSPFLACTPIHAEALTTSTVPHYTACAFKGSEKRPKHQSWHVTEILQKPITKDLPIGGHKKKNSQFNESLSRIGVNYVANITNIQKCICMYGLKNLKRANEKIILYWTFQMISTNNT